MQNKPILLYGDMPQGLYKLILGKAGFEIVGSITGDSPSAGLKCKGLKASHPVLAIGLSGESYLEQIRLIRERLNLRNNRILHPAFLAEHSGTKLSGNIIVAGANRSGSTLLFTVLKRLLEFNSVRPDEEMTLFSELSRSHFDLLISVLDASFRKAGAVYTGSGAVTFRHIDYFGAGPGKCFFLSPLRTQRHFFDRIHRTYTPINRDIISRASSLGQSVFVPMRNPLDIIISNAFELEYVYYNMFPGEDLDQVESDFRENYGRAHLTNLDWFEDCCSYVKEHMESFLDFRKNCTPIRYEELMTDPVGTMKGLSKLFCDEPVPDGTLKQIWEKEIYCRPLATYKAHMFRPGVGKSRHYLCTEHIDILKRMKYGSLLKALGYDAILEADQSISSLKYPISERLSFAMQIRDRGFNIQAGSRLCHPRGSFRNANPEVAGCQLHFSSNSSAFNRTFKSLAEADEFRTLLTLLDYQ